MNFFIEPSPALKFLPSVRYFDYTHTILFYELRALWLSRPLHNSRRISCELISSLILILLDSAHVHRLRVYVPTFFPLSFSPASSWSGTSERDRNACKFIQGNCRRSYIQSIIGPHTYILYRVYVLTIYIKNITYVFNFVFFYYRKRFFCFSLSVSLSLSLFLPLFPFIFFLP